MRRILAVLGLLIAALFAAPAIGHHGWGSYDANKVMSIDAAPVEVRYRNPHAEIAVDHDGSRWQVILAPTARMESRGLAAGALKVGKTITIVGYPRSDGTRELRAERIVVDGKTIELR